MAINTGKWFFEHTKFRNWKDSRSSSLLIVTGPSDQGKSVMARHFVDHPPEDGSMSYFFFHKRREEAQSPVCAVAAVLHRWFNDKTDLARKKAVSWLT